ncbi:MAG: SCP2 sterol-binding domain-containing protein [Defluviitaleaceae bacterium]|nr:SCP2 sterol-binding domain-containing protein [Defluviitaleaceae bacterium]MCL2239016.1 SCP2 sterol-binding domain-containing protein [Defluviitaleaceae bacterium]
MKIAYISGNLPHFDKGLAKLLAYTKDVFAELGVEMSELNLGVVHPPYFDGVRNAHLDGQMASIKEADGIILACSASFFAPSAILQTFLEYFELPEYARLLQAKHCALIVVSDEGGERGALQYLSRVVQHMGGYDTTQIGLQASHMEALEESDYIRDFIDKELEVFYRAVHQNRKKIIPQDYVQGVAGAVPSGGGKASGKSTHTHKRLDAFTEQQERDIEELSRLFAEKYTEPGEEGEDDFINEDDDLILAPITPLVAAPARKKTARQLTQNLPHYFQPQLSAGTQAVIQISINGTETFEGYLTIQSKECTYTDGIAEAPDVTVIADAALWLDVLNAKFTAQKAFMIGGLKVRGALALFTKFDTLFKLAA